MVCFLKKRVGFIRVVPGWHSKTGTYIYLHIENKLVKIWNIGGD